jgi:hypothetical protein
MTRRLRIDGPTAAVAIMQAAMREIRPPGHVRLDDQDLPFWHSVIAEFGRSEWTEHQIEMAALLARTMADLEREQYALRDEGYVLTRPSGVTMQNPRNRTVQALTSHVLAMRRSLALHARVQGGGTRNIARRSALTKEIEAAISLDDPLIGRLRPTERKNDD